MAFWSRPTPSGRNTRKSRGTPSSPTANEKNTCPFHSRDPSLFAVSRFHLCKSPPARSRHHRCDKRPSVSSVPGGRSWPLIRRSERQLTTMRSHSFRISEHNSSTRGADFSARRGVCPTWAESYWMKGADDGNRSRTARYSREVKPIEKHLLLKVNAAKSGTEGGVGTKVPGLSTGSPEAESLERFKTKVHEKWDCRRSGTSRQLRDDWNR